MEKAPELKMTGALKVTTRDVSGSLSRVRKRVAPVDGDRNQTRRIGDVGNMRTKVAVASGVDPTDVSIDLDRPE